MRSRMVEGRNDGSGVMIWIGVFIILGGIGFSLITFFDSRKAQAPEPPLPAGIPGDIPLMYAASAAADSDVYIVRLEDNVSLRVEFKELGSFKKLWSGSNASFSVELPGVPPATASTHSETWGNVLVSQAPGNQSFTPWVQSKINFDQNYLHTWVVTRARLSVVYPSVMGTSFQNAEKDLSREVQFYGVTDEEFTMLSAHHNWQDAVEEYENKNYIWGYICSGIVFLAGIIFIFQGINDRIKKRLERKYGWLR